MNRGVSKLTFETPTEAAEAVCTPTVRPVSKWSDAPVLKQLLQKFASDEKLAQDLADGDADALTELYRRHCSLLFNVARRILHGDGEAEDVMQQAFLDVFRAIHQFRPEKGPFKTWLLMFAYQRALNHRRTLRAQQFFCSDSLDDSMLDSLIPSTREILTPSEARILIRETLASLPERECRTIELVYYHGLTAAEISRCTGETVRVVRHNLYRGLEKLRRSICEKDSGTQCGRTHRE